MFTIVHKYRIIGRTVTGMCSLIDIQSRRHYTV